MSSIHMRTLVALLGSLALQGCARTLQQGERYALQSDRAEDDRREALRFDNAGRDRVDIYLIGETRSWRIGRLEAGQARWLELPRDMAPGDRVRMQMVVLVNAPLSVDPRTAPHAVTTLRQPVGILSAQRWSFTQGQLSATRLNATGARR